MNDDPEVGTYVPGRGYFLGRRTVPGVPWPVVDYSETHRTHDELADALAAELVKEMARCS
jgi:hypothetical protein